MHFKRPDLQQLTPQYLSTLPQERVAQICEQMRQDLMNAHDRLGQNPTNSSAPPSTRKPWERDSKAGDEEQQELVNEIEQQIAQEADNDKGDSKDTEESQTNDAKDPEQKKRKPGKQQGAPGFGRTQKLTITEIEIHKPVCCAGCGETLDVMASFQATGGYCSIEIAPPES